MDGVPVGHVPVLGRILAHGRDDDAVGELEGTELQRLEQLLSAGMVDRRVLSEFRYAVDSARKTGWQVEKWLDGDTRELSTMMTEERIHCITRMSNHLASELEVEVTQFAGMDALREAMRKLNSALMQKA